MGILAKFQSSSLSLRSSSSSWAAHFFLCLSLVIPLIISSVILILWQIAPEISLLINLPSMLPQNKTITCLLRCLKTFRPTVTTTQLQVYDSVFRVDDSTHAEAAQNYRKWGTHARVFSQTLAHGNSKNEITFFS